jgi:hypothetical protein
MINEKSVKTFLKDNRLAARIVLTFVAAAMLAVPPLIITFTPGGWSSWLSWTIRLFAMYAFTLIFMNIVTGALAPYFYVVFKARGEYLLHVVTGALGFSFALAHGLIVITQRYYRGFGAAWIIGPVALILLVFTVWVALDRQRLKRVWRSIHIVNYAIFAAVYLKALLIGTDFKRVGGAGKAAFILFTAYAVLALLALLVRLRRYQVQVAKRKEASGAGEPTAGTDG